MLQHLKFVMRSKSVDVQREAVRGVANISAEYAYTAVIAGAGAIMPLVAMLSSPDFLCQRWECITMKLSSFSVVVTFIFTAALVYCSNPRKGGWYSQGHRFHLFYSQVRDRVKSDSL